MHLPQDFGHTPLADLVLPPESNGLVLHCCCAPCAGAVLECLKVNHISPVVFFYNPNIHPLAEYEKRRDELLEMCSLLGFEAVVGDYDTKEWFEKVRGHEDEPERSARCQICFAHRLQVTAVFAKERGINTFTSTLATSRWKNVQQVNAAGYAAEKLTGVKYYDRDWRKNGLVTRRYELVRSMDFYNQLYCGCVFSQRNAQLNKEVHRKIRCAPACQCSPEKKEGGCTESKD